MTTRTTHADASRTTHADASAPLFGRNLVSEQKLSFGKFFQGLHLNLPKDEPDAMKLLETGDGAIFKTFWDGTSYNWKNEPENVLQKDFTDLLYKILPAQKFMVELERRHNDRSRSDIIVSIAPGGLDSGRIIGRPILLLELKSTKADFKFPTHKDQLIHYVKELLGRHVSIELLPFVLFNGISYFVGYVKWFGFHKFEIFLNSQRFDILDKYQLLLFA
jgi:hypothetical protein